MDYDKLYGNRKVDYQATDLICLLAMSRIRRVTIVLRMSGAAGRDILSGIFHFARSHPHWHTRLFQMPDEFTPESFQTEMSNGIDGIIASEPGPDETARQVCASSVPVSFIGDPGPILAKRRRAISSRSARTGRTVSCRRFPTSTGAYPGKRDSRRNCPRAALQRTCSSPRAWPVPARTLPR